MQTFKFFQKKQGHKISFLKLKNAHNRNINMLCGFEEFPDVIEEQDEIISMKQYRGNILTFFNHISEQRSPNGRPVYPIIYNMILNYRGYSEREFNYSNYKTQNDFISRKYYLIINYRIKFDERI